MTAPIASIAVVSARLMPTDIAKVCMTNIINTPSAAAPPTGANHRSRARPEKRAYRGNRLAIQIANKHGNASAALTPHRAVVLTVSGNAMAQTMTSDDKTSQPENDGTQG